MHDLNPHNYDSTDHNNVVYEPWISDEQIGYRVWFPGGEVRYLYFNPSLNDDGEKSNVFVYYGRDGDPASDEPWHHYLIEAEVADD